MTSPELPIYSGARIMHLGQAAPLVPSSSRLRWGPFYVSSLDAFQVYETFEFSNTGDYLINRLSLLRGHITFDKQLGRTRLALQYQPRLGAVNGEFRQNLLNQKMNIDTFYVLSPRLNLFLGDHVIYLNNRNLVAENFLQSEGLGGGTLQLSFLESGGRWIRNDAIAGLAFMHSPRTLLTVSERYVIGYASNPLSSTRGEQYGSEVALARAIARTATLGIFYLGEVIHHQATGGTTIYHSVGLSYSHRVRPTWWINGTARAVAADVSPDAGIKRFRPAGSFSTVKSFGWSRFSLAYTRGSGFNGYVTNRYADRVDTSLNIYLTKRWETSFGIGYHRETGNAPLISGKYGVFSTAFHMTHALVLFGHYGRKVQQSPTNFLLSGTSNLAVAGLRWEPPEAAR